MFENVTDHGHHRQGKGRMVFDAPTRLRLAIAGARFGGGASKLATRVRRDGPTVYEEVFETLTSAQVEQVDDTAERLTDQEVVALLLTDNGYPPLLATSRNAPPALFVKGAHQVLSRPSVGTCGSRHAGEESLRAARACSEVVASREFNLVSGYARGVDMVTHIGALASGGTTTIVMAEGIERFRVRREFAEEWDPSRCVVVSQFSPTQPWSAGAAMTRNAVISGLSRALVVVEAGETGGTLAAGLHALDRGQPVLVLQLNGAHAGNQILVNRGATPVHSREELDGLLADLPSNGNTQLTLI
jgi:DNA processing protein